MKNPQYNLERLQDLYEERLSKNKLSWLKEYHTILHETFGVLDQRTERVRQLVDRYEHYHIESYIEQAHDFIASDIAHIEKSIEMEKKQPTYGPRRGPNPPENKEPLIYRFIKNNPKWTITSLIGLCGLVGSISYVIGGYMALVNNDRQKINLESCMDENVKLKSQLDKMKFEKFDKAGKEN